MFQKLRKTAIFEKFLKATTFTFSLKIVNFRMFYRNSATSFKLRGRENELHETVKRSALMLY